MHESQTLSWATLVDTIADRFPGTTAKDLMELDGNLTKMIRHLAITNDLTVAEAEETVALTVILNPAAPHTLRAA